jgi:hypothetical protein
VDDAVEIIVEKVLKNSPRPKPLLIRLDGNLRNSY